MWCCVVFSVCRFEPYTPCSQRYCRDVTVNPRCGHTCWTQSTDKGTRRRVDVDESGISLGYERGGPVTLAMGHQVCVPLTVISTVGCGDDGVLVFLSQLLSVGGMGDTG